MKVEFFYRTSRGATAMKFFDIDKARAWYANQKEKHGDALPKMVLIRHVTTVKETIYDDESVSCPTII